MIKKSEKVFSFLINLLTLLSVGVFLFVFVYIIKEAVPLFRSVRISEFIFGKEWMPISFGFGTNFGILYFILGTIYVSVLAVVISFFFGMGIALFLSFQASPKLRSKIMALVDLLSGIPSVIYGFIALDVLSPLFIKMGVKTGNCVLLAAIVLSVMVLPYITASTTYTFLNLKKKYADSIENLGIEKWYGIVSIIIPASGKKTATSIILANCRAMGETMAVMMVMGNATVLPKLFGKGESIASLIALEMGTAVKGSPHYHALYAAGLVLLLMVLVCNIILHYMEKRFAGEEK